jgi:hypothetical protein
MNKFFASLALFLLVSINTIGNSPTVFAQANTSSDNNPGQVRTRNADGTLYLTTAVNGNTIAPAQNPSSVDARTVSAIIGQSLTRPAGFADNLGSYISSVLNITMVICLLLVFYNFLSAGLQWITSGGDKGKTEEARNKIVNAVVGIVIVASSYALVTFVAYVLGFSSINEALSSVKQINPS